MRAVEAELERVARVRTLLTERPGHGTELAAAGGDAVVVFSGDGGINEVLNGAPPGVPLGFLPGGGANVLARALGLPRDPAAAARQVADALESGRTRTISLGPGERPALRLLGGHRPRRRARAARRRARPPGRRQAPGRPRLRRERRAAGGRAARCASSRRSRSQGRGRAAFALVANGDPYTYAGSIPIRVAPEARFELGLDLVAPKRVRAATLPRLLRYVLTGRGQARSRRAALRRTTSTGSRSPATGRCRCRPTARTSATSSTRSSRPSAARWPCSSRVPP